MNSHDVRIAYFSERGALLRQLRFFARMYARHRNPVCKEIMADLSALLSSLSESFKSGSYSEKQERLKELDKHLYKVAKHDV